LTQERGFLITMGKYAEMLANRQRSQNILTIQNNQPIQSMPAFKDGCIHQVIPEPVLREERIRMSLKQVMRPDTVTSALASKMVDLSKLEDTNPDGSLVPVEKLTEELIKNGLSGLSVATIASLMEDEEVPPGIRLAAAKYALDRVLGKPVSREELNVTNTVSIKQVVINSSALDVASDMKDMGLIYNEALDV
jgi:hypothetical protein